MKTVWDNVKGFAGGLKKGTKIAIVVILIVTVAAIAALLVHSNNRPYAVLYSGMRSESLQEVLSYFGSVNFTDYKLQGDDTILVRDNQVSALRGQLALQGYPSSGYSYDTYLNGVSALASQSELDQRKLLDLQEKLAYDIRGLVGVQEASVVFAPGEDHRYILNQDDVVEASATVTVTMENNASLSRQMADAIRTMVGTAYSGLSVDNISIVDQNGETYTAGETVDASDAAALKLLLENKVNTATHDNVLELLSAMYGRDNVYVAANSTVDVSRMYTDQTHYDLPDWASDGSTGGKGIIGTEVYDHIIVRGEDQTVAGVAGEPSNSELNEYVVNYSPDGTEQSIGISGTNEYNVDTTHTQRETVSGVVTDLMVAVVINSEAVEGAVDVNLLLPVVARAAGITPEQQAEKVSILAQPFYAETDTEPEPPIVVAPGVQMPAWMLYAFIAGLALFLVLLVVIILLVLRSKKKRRAQQLVEEQQAAAAAEQARQIALGEAVTPTGGADIMDLQSERSLELRQQVRQFVEDNPEIAAHMVKQMLKGDDDDG